MSSFTKPLIVKVLDGGEKYEIKESFEYYLEGNKKVVISIPK